MVLWLVYTTIIMILILMMGEPNYKYEIDVLIADGLATQSGSKISKISFVKSCMYDC